MQISFGHHLSLTYRGGGEKWLTQLANELVHRGHEVTIRCLPFWKRDNPVDIPEVDYKEGYFHSLGGDVVYITYNPLSWLNFKTKSPKIGGIHSHCYWQPFAWRYGILPNIANFVHMITKRWELGKFDAIHIVTPVYPLNIKNLYYIPNFVSSDKYTPVAPKFDEFTVGYSSRKVWQKGYDIFTKLKEIMPEISFVETDNIPEVDMPRFYSRNHATVVPARVDTFGLVNVESLLCGVPVISSGLLTHRALDLPLKYAHNLQTYRAHILELKKCYEAGMYPELSDICRRAALKFSMPNVVDQLENMFEEVSGCA